MAYSTSHQELQYLPVELSSQTFALPMNDAVAIHRKSVDTDGEQLSTDEHAANLPILDLRHLFQIQSNPDTSMYVIVVSTEIGTCALAVDRVRPTRTIETAALYPLPRLISTVGWLFKGVIRDSDNLILLIDSQRLVETVQQMSPDLVLAEETHVS
jgi:chemotaxis protein histidine kinase CheA